MRRSKNSVNQNPDVQQSPQGQKKWTKEDYENYDKYLEAEHERELETINAEHERAEKLRQANFRREEARKEAENARLAALLKSAKAHGNVESVSIDENGNHSIVFKRDQY
jgi:hypothetical protein